MAQIAAPQNRTLLMSRVLGKHSDGFRALITAGLFVLFALWLLRVMSSQIGQPAFKDPSTGLVTDSWGQVKDVFQSLLSLLTLVLGYWFGSRGSDQARQDAKDAQTKASLIAGEASPEAVQRAMATYDAQHPESH